MILVVHLYDTNIKKNEKISAFPKFLTEIVVIDRLEDYQIPVLEILYI